jgi:hypothetical protein
MTKKDFIELAEQLAIVKREYDAKRHDFHGTAAEDMWKECVYAVMLACKTTSANFDRGKFLNACGIPNIGVK